jgi:hypothetical protein
MPGSNQIIGSFREYVELLESHFQTLKNQVDLIGQKLNGEIDSSTPRNFVIGRFLATQIILARAAIPVICHGIFSTAVPIGEWHSTTTYNPSFSAGINRLTPPTVATSGTLVEFTHSLGVLTYTGARTRRFKIDYDITIRYGANGSNMTLFNSIDGSTAIGIQTQIRKQVDTKNNGIFEPLHFSGVITLSSNQTTQLAGACAILSSAVQYQYVSCNIIGLLD